MTVYFTSDLHFGHTAIMEYEKRPFRTVGKMDAALLRNYNEVVGKDDEVFILGDMALCGPTKKEWLRAIVERMKGSKHLILGNHDTLHPWDFMEMGFLSVHTALEAHGFMLTHDPAVSIVAKNRTWLCGHVHSLFERAGNCINVGVDVRGYKPISFGEVAAITGTP